jgi:hypothetical protein
MTDMTFAASTGRFSFPLGVRLFLRADALAALAVALAAYQWFGYSWWLFAAVFLAPDLAIAGYLRGPRFGALAYNLAHTYAAPFVLGLAGFLAGSSLALALAIVWTAHIALDRVLGLGLKLPSNFRATHLSA